MPEKMRCGGGGIADADLWADLADLGAEVDLPLVLALGGGALATAEAVAKAAALLAAPDARMPPGGAWYRFVRHSAACGAVTAAVCRCAAARRANEISISDVARGNNHGSCCACSRL